MKDYALIYNPIAAAGKTKKKFDLAVKTLENLNVSFDLFKTEHFGHAIELGETLAKDGYRVIAAGGDGTCNEVLNGVIASKTNVLLGFIPIGTGNDIPGAVGYAPKQVKRACEIIASGESGPVDIGLSLNSTGEKRYFLGIGSQGFDAEVTKRTNEGSKMLPGTWNYIASVVRSVFGFKKRQIRVTLDNGTYIGECNLVAVGNGKTYGGFMYMCPRADVHDGLFHISIVNMGRFELLYKFNTMYSKTLHPDRHIKEFFSRTVKIEMFSQDDPSYIAQVDGEIIGDLPIQYECIKDGYTFIKPREDEAEKWFKERYGKKFFKYVERLKKNGIDYY
ncbi:MAG: diacylglycerol kinase family lipid kinase [Candidatus Lokiarchaeota archaeon]|nr:diacylglycerol kinase family lipid kinase [Candidatus Harpocratesius repetitus]